MYLQSVSMHHLVHRMAFICTLDGKLLLQDIFFFPCLNAFFHIQNAHVYFKHHSLSANLMESANESELTGHKLKMFILPRRLAVSEPLNCSCSPDKSPTPNLHQDP